MSSELFTYIWQYTIHAEFESEFLNAYGPDGEWASLFSMDAGYVRTELLQSSANNNQYLTIDYWTSKMARDSFLEKYAKVYDVLDQKCESYTRKEELLGDFFVMAKRNNG